MITTVIISPSAEKDLKKVPQHIQSKLRGWVELVEQDSLEEARKVKGFHDEPLQGKRWGQRSIRLSKAYRAIYVIKKDRVEFVLVEEVNKHDY